MIRRTCTQLIGRCISDAAALTEKLQLAVNKTTTSQIIVVSCGDNVACDRTNHRKEM